MINKGAVAEYSEVEMSLGALPRDLRAKALLKLELDSRDPWTFTHDELWNCVFHICVTANVVALLDLERAFEVLGVSPYSISTGVVLPQMPVEVNLPASPSEETLAPAQATEKIPITKAKDTIHIKMDNFMKAFVAWTFQMSNVNEPRYGGYNTARAYPIQDDHPPSHTAMNYPPPNTPMGTAYYQPGPEYQQYPQQWLGPCISGDDPRHISRFCPKVHINHEEGIVHLNQCGRVTSGSRAGNGGEISWYGLERRFLSMGEYTWEVARPGQKGGRVATITAPHPPQLQHVARSQQFQRASAQVTVFHSGIARQQSEVNGYYFGWSTGEEERNWYCIK